jgi:hypothetical protein
METITKNLNNLTINNTLKQTKVDDVIESLEEFNIAQKRKKSILSKYIHKYKNSSTMIQYGDDLEDDDAYDIMTVRHGHIWVKIKVKRNT